MNRQENQSKRDASAPADLQVAHQHSIDNRAEVEGSTLCGCFHCGAKLRPAEIIEWVDANREGEGQTALCPRCGVDSIIGDRSGFDISDELLSAMQARWF